MLQMSATCELSVLPALCAELMRYPLANQEQPFGPSPYVYKIGSPTPGAPRKMFALLAWDAQPLQLSLKCQPDYALALRSQFAAIQPGYHLAKAHWNTLILDERLPQSLVFELIRHSYHQVVAGLRQSEQKLLRQTYPLFWQP